jgi:glycosyltransferase involved in cell wall biosynthesis
VKILVVTNLYPPHHQGGYELRCSQVVDYLHQRGHDVRVVASSYQIADAAHGAVVRDDERNGVPVCRFLRQHRLDPRQPDGRLYNLDVVRRQVKDITRFGRMLDEFRPDVVSWWNLEGVTKAILRMPHDRGIPSVHCIDDNWMIREYGRAGDVDLPFWFDFWRANWGPRVMRPLVRACLQPVEARLQRQGVPTRVFGVPPAHVCFIGEFWRVLHAQAGLDVERSDVIYGGVEADRFYARRAPEDYAAGPLRLLYAGYIDRRRGLLTIVEALGLLTARQRERFHLSVAHGGPVVPDEYVNEITARITQLGLSTHVTFLGRVPHGEMAAVYASHDVLVFASTRNEGIPMVMMEAMCAGCAVPNTGSGGAIELAEKADTPLFPKDHPFALSRLLVQLESDRGRVAQIAARGQQAVLRDFTLQRMLERTEDVLSRAATHSAGAVRAAVSQ